MILLVSLAHFLLKNLSSALNLFLSLSLHTQELTALALQGSSVQQSMRSSLAAVAVVV